MGCRFGLCDLRRAATDIILSPDHKLAAVCDTLGRVLVIDCFKGIVLKIFKGYREGQCSFIQVADERKSKSRLENKVAHFLVIYSPKKGTIEVFSVQQGSKIAVFSASKHSRLLYVSYGLQGFTTASKSKRSCVCTTLFIDNTGLIKELLIPFHFTLSEKNNKRAKDLHLYKKFRHLLKTGDLENEKILNEALNICTELNTNDIKCQIVEFLLDNKNLSAEFILNCVNFFLENLDGEDNKNLKILCQNTSVLLKLFIFLSNPCKSEDRNAEDNAEFSFNTEVKEMVNLRKLLNLSIINDIANMSQPHVKFSDNLDFSASKFVSAFDYSTPETIPLKRNYDEKLLFKVSELLFKPYIDGKSQNFTELQEKLKETKIPTKNLFDLLLNYWVNRSLNLSSKLEEDMKKLLTLLNVIVKTSVGEIEEIEYSEISGFWSYIRSILIDSSRPFPALMAAILCKIAAQTCMKATLLDESSTSLGDMEVLTQEDIEWGLVIGKNKN